MLLTIKLVTKGELKRILLKYALFVLLRKVVRNSYTVVLDLDIINNLKIMRTHLIGYDLNKQGQDYTTLIKEIKKFGNWWHCLDSTFIIKSNQSCGNIRDHLTKFIDSNDELLVVRLNGEGAWIGFDSDCSKWLKENLTYD